MSNTKPSLARGTRDFGPDKMAKRNYIFNTIKTVFEKFGFQPIETPAIENLGTLMGKYGDEGDQLLFKILNSGNFSEKISQADLDNGYKSLTSKVSEKGLRYDLTVPFARFVAMNRNELAFPFKRYQIQPVWRADRPQRGRYREFYQCDADVVGTNSLICEAEIVAMLQEILTKFGLEYSIKINNRKILTGISETIGQQGKEAILAVAIDKLDKIGKEKVLEELVEKGFSTDSILKLEQVFNISGSDSSKLDGMSAFLESSQIGTEGILELKQVFDLAKAYGLNVNNVNVDFTLARGLSYYTGAIFEVKVNNVQMGSISGGGRYDNLTDTFGLPGVSGVGISLGVDRIYDVIEELNLFPENAQVNSKVVVSNFDENTLSKSLEILNKLRLNGINSEIYPDSAKLKKQFDYAFKKGTPYFMIVGADEIEKNIFGLKNLITGVQENLEIEDIISKLQSI